MKRVLSIIFVLVLIIGSVGISNAASSVTLAWNKPDAAAPHPRGYVILWGTSAGNYSDQVQIESSTCTSGGVEPDNWDCKTTVNYTFTPGIKYYFTARSWEYDASGNGYLYSGNSNEVQYTDQGGGGGQGVVPGVPKTLRLSK